MSNFKVGDRVRTTNKCLSPNDHAYHNVVGTVVKVRGEHTLPIRFRADTPVENDPGDWALFEDEIELLAPEIDWKSKYEELRAQIDTFKAGLAAYKKIMED